MGARRGTSRWYHAEMSEQLGPNASFLLSFEETADRDMPPPLPGALAKGVTFSDSFRRNAVKGRNA